MTAARVARRLVRKAIKPLRLRFISWRYQQSQREISRLDEMRQDACALMQIEHRRQVELQMQRNQIAGW